MAASGRRADGLRKRIRLRPSEDLSVGAQLEVWTRRSALVIVFTVVSALGRSPKK
jgi:hypothetical protein